MDANNQLLTISDGEPTPFIVEDVYQDHILLKYVVLIELDSEYFNTSNERKYYVIVKYCYW